MQWEIVVYDKINGDAPVILDTFDGSFDKAKSYATKKYAKYLKSSRYYLTVNCYNLIGE